MLKHREAAIETTNRFTNRMPKLTPQMARKVRLVTGKALQEDIEVSKDSVPDDVAMHINSLKQENADLRATVGSLMSKIDSILNHLTPNAPAQVTELTKTQEAPAPETDDLSEASAKVKEAFNQPPRRGPRRAPASLPDAES